MILAGAVTPDDHVVSCILLLLMQHWFVLVRHISNTLYIILELTLELWFEWTIISEFQNLASNHWTASCKFPFLLFVTSHHSCISLSSSVFFFTVAAGVMLVAHWEYLLAAGIDLFFKPKAPVDYDDSLDNTSLNDEETAAFTTMRNKDQAARPPNSEQRGEGM
jgi:hypothetical protein